MNVVDRFLDYVRFDTQSDELTNMTPSTPGQMIFAQYLQERLQEMGLEDISLDDNGYLMATLPSNTADNVPTVGFIAHLDTSPDMSGRHVKPRIVEAYDGGDITLNTEEGIVLSPSEFPELLNYVGQDLIVTDGTTLLGADDKAGIAEIVSAVAYLKEHPEIKHGKSASLSTPMRKSARARISLTYRFSGLIGLTPWTGAKSANWNTRISTLPWPAYRSRAATCIRATPSIR